MSSVAGILSPDGGLRVVVAERREMLHHLGPGERLFVLPNYQVDEPVPGHQIAEMIRRVEQYVAKHR